MSSNESVATVATNGTVTVGGAGTTTLTVSQAGDANYNAATSVTQTLTVTPAAVATPIGGDSGGSATPSSGSESQPEKIKKGKNSKKSLQQKIQNPILEAMLKNPPATRKQKRSNKI